MIFSYCNDCVIAIIYHFEIFIVIYCKKNWYQVIAMIFQFKLLQQIFVPPLYYTILFGTTIILHYTFWYHHYTIPPLDYTSFIFCLVWWELIKRHLKFKKNHYNKFGNTTICTIFITWANCYKSCRNYLGIKLFETLITLL